MPEWTVVTVIISLVGLFVTVSKPLMNLQKAITQLESAIKSMEKRLSDYEIKTDGQEKILNNHETRIEILEDHEHKVDK